MENRSSVSVEAQSWSTVGTCPPPHPIPIPPQCWSLISDHASASCDLWPRLLLSASTHTCPTPMTETPGCDLGSRDQLGDGGGGGVPTPGPSGVINPERLHRRESSADSRPQVCGSLPHLGGCDGGVEMGWGGFNNCLISCSSLRVSEISPLMDRTEEFKAC